ncbi:MAG: EscU/YscU/HrcU family type III secretion system export apparatus switch protein, partial [Pseudomonadota bacterium]
MSEPNDGADKSHEASPQKLEDARKRGDIPKSQDLSTAAAFFGLLIAMTAFGAAAVHGFGAAGASAFGRADALAPRMLSGGDMLARWTLDGVGHLWTFFAFPALLVFLSVFAQRAFVFAPEKLAPKLSRISPLENAKQKFGVTGLVA